MIHALRDQQTTLGAHFADDTASIPLSFGNDPVALEAAHTGIALVDRCHWGQIVVSGTDRLRFLHNQTTNAFQLLQPGQGCDTVFVSSTARTIDLVSAYVTDESVLLLTSPGQNSALMQWMDRFIFPADRVELRDITSETATFSLLGARSAELVRQMGASLEGAALNTHQPIEWHGIPLRIAVGGGLALPGYTLMGPIDRAAETWQHLVSAGAIPLGEQAWEQLRITQGRPMPAQELTEDYNPLEAGLWYTISLTKGCYIGQETIARLHTYKGVKQQLWGIKLDQAVPPGSLVRVGEEKVGTLTSCVLTLEGYRGLAYIRTKAVQPGLSVTIDQAHGELVALPFVSHDYI